MKLDAQWIVGFVDGEGCFHVGVAKHSDMKMGYQVLPEFTVVQHEKDTQVLEGLKGYFGVGVVRSNHGNRKAYRVRDHRHLFDLIIPFFQKHPLKTRKRQDFEKFKRVVQLMEKGKHLEPDGFEAIQKIASEMNRNQLR